jgi:carboxymethylenebutenolidase
LENQIIIDSKDGTFRAYVARPEALPAPAVVVLHEVFGVNADIRKTCDELAEQGFIAIAPDLFWRQEPGVDLSVTSEPDWQHGLRLNQAYDRDAGARDVKDTAEFVAKLPECTSRVAVLGYCLGGLMAFLTAVRYGVDAAVAYHGGDTEKYLGEVDGLYAPMLMHLAEEDEFISGPAQAQIKTALAGKRNATVYSYPGQHHAFARHGGAHTTTPPRLRSPTGGRANFYIINCGDHHCRREPAMPMIDIYATVGTFADVHTLAADAAAVVKGVEKVPDIPMFRQNTAAFVHEMAAGAIVNVDGDRGYVRVQVLTNAGALDREKQIAVVSQLTDLVAAAANDPGLKMRTWVLLTEATPGGWGLWGHAHTNDELVAAARAEIAKLRG